ncbi:hypothetical protein DPEC_G00199700 [Dallia pectoralis]|uniref:Uncharacterized protein n=1 Tax=Dallia pectoralis TaxID=75939 RepID=A0ACC2G8Z7_DALPE|nr:hypothetical protein DPEC_G00199700 [Dallia pectoralis]
MRWRDVLLSWLASRSQLSQCTAAPSRMPTGPSRARGCPRCQLACQPVPPPLLRLTPYPPLSSTQMHSRWARAQILTRSGRGDVWRRQERQQHKRGRAIIPIPRGNPSSSSRQCLKPRRGHD